jgi:glycosyltransferase involved in cell wall biosynthesis
MNLLVFTPGAKTSAIGRMTSLVTRELVSAGHGVTVVRSETETLLATPSHDFDAPVLDWTDHARVLGNARAADGIVYAIGDSYGFHRGALEWLPKLPGLICLHDFFLGDLFHGWAQADLSAANAILRTWYGEESALRFFSHRTVEDFIEGTRQASPMTEWVCAMASGVITHSNWGVERVLSSCAGPVRVVPLAYDAASLPSTTSDVAVNEGDRFRVLTVGHINPNKRVAGVIRAIGNSASLCERTTYRLAGSIRPETAQQLTALAKQCHVDLVISGQVDELTLARAFEEADVVSCLRWPSLEAASASAIEAMLYAKPTIVTDTGFYSEIPDACVVKIDAGRELDDLQAALEHLAVNRDARRALGIEARRWAEATFSAPNYAEAIVQMVVVENRCKPLLAAVDYFAERTAS